MNCLQLDKIATNFTDKISKSERIPLAGSYGLLLQSDSLQYSQM